MNLHCMVAYKTTSGEKLYLNPSSIAAVLVCDVDEETLVYLTGIAEPHRLPLRTALGIIEKVEKHLMRMVPL